MDQLRPPISTEEFLHAWNEQVCRRWGETKVHHLTVNRTDQPCGLQACLRHALRLARWMGFFPVQGLGQTRADGTRFKIKCYYCCYYIATFIGQAVMSSFAIWHFFQTDVGFGKLTNVMFYLSNFISTILLLKLSQQWPRFMVEVTEIEQALTELELEKKTVVQTTVIAHVAVALAIVEYILCTLFNIKLVTTCPVEAGITANFMENFITQTMPHVFDYIPYSTFSAFLFQIIWVQTTILWSCNDVIITCFSIYITAYFRNLNKIIAANAKKEFGLPWSVLRVHYSNLVKLVNEIDVQISSFILMACFVNLYYICGQVFNSLHQIQVSSEFCDEAQTKQVLSSPYYLIYYLYSFTFIVLRTLMLLLFTSNVHCATLEPVYSVCDVPSSVYDIEVHRFHLQLDHTVALSGKIFYVTRNTILQMLSLIATYEIVLLGVVFET